MTNERWWTKGAGRMELNGTVTNIGRNCDGHRTEWNGDCSRTKWQLRQCDGHGVGCELYSDGERQRNGHGTGHELCINGGQRRDGHNTRHEFWKDGVQKIKVNL